MLQLAKNRALARKPERRSDRMMDSRHNEHRSVLDCRNLVAEYGCSVLLAPGS
jgi:hypothetical protein